MSKRVSRRDVLHRTVSACAGFWVWDRARAAPSVAPSEMLRVAIVGLGGRGGFHFSRFSKRRGCQVVAICEVDSRKVPKFTKRNPDLKVFSDFRRMFDTMGRGIDAVVVATPDNTHAAPCLWAMVRGKHAMVEKPLALTVGECRWLARLARENKVTTQLANQHHSGYGYRRAAELTRAGVIGQVTEVHCEGIRPRAYVWPDAERLAAMPEAKARLPGLDDAHPVPEWLDWDSYVGPAAMRPFHPTWLGWKGWRDLGLGHIGDFFCHWCDLPYTALDLKYPTTVETVGPKTHPARVPRCSSRLEFPARGDRPPVTLYWHGCGDGPGAELLEGVEGDVRKRYQVLLIGSEGRMLAGCGRTEPLLLPRTKFENVELPEAKAKQIDHYRAWVDGIRNGKRCECDFDDYAQYLGEGAPLALVAYWAGEKIEWDGPNMEVTNCPRANKWVQRQFRRGWGI
jgi:hypothetical protein